jgi:hypothetical protein
VSAVVDAPPVEALLACCRGRFVPSFRNRAVGQETVRASRIAGGGARLSAETEIVIGRFALRQSVVADLDGALRPRSCRVITTSGSQELSLEVTLEDHRAVACHRWGGRSRARTQALAHEPLLLVDNCFSLHALAALVAHRRAGEWAVFQSIPAFEELTVTVPGTAPVLLGGSELAPPAVTLHLAPDLQEHAWIAGAWVERLVIPQTQIRVDWLRNGRTEGGSS